MGTLQDFFGNCPHSCLSELHQLDSLYNPLNTNDQDALDFAAGGNFLDKMPRDGLAIIESKSKDESEERNDKPCVNIAGSLMMFKTTRTQEEAREFVITTVNAECSAIIMNKVPEKLEDPGKFLIPCALQELDRTSALADSGASINIFTHSFYKQIGLEAPDSNSNDTRVANHPRVPIILGRPFLRTAKALIDLYEEKLTLRVGKEELVYYADKSEKNEEKKFKFIDEFTLPNSLPSGDDVSIHKKDIHEETFSNSLFEFDDNFKSSNVNPLFEEKDKDVEIKSSPSFTLTSPEESELVADLEREFDSHRILPPPWLDSDSPFIAELSASFTLNSLGNEDKVFKPEPSTPRPPSEPPDVCMRFKPILAIKDDFVKPNEDFYLSETVLSLNVEDVDSSTFIIWTFLPYFTYPKDSPLIFSFRRLIQQFLKPLVSGVVSCFTRASYPLFEFSLGRSDILSSYRFTFIFS
ncbi:reverse transcriptase domain-containing protein [Tanacetum coccineum]